MQDNRKKLFADNPKQAAAKPEQSLSSEPDYFKLVPIPLLAVFGWFSYKAIISVYSIFALRLVLFQNPQPPVQRLFTIAFPLLFLVAYWLIVFGLIKQTYWTKIVLVVWYIIFWLYVSCRIYALFIIGDSNYGLFYQLQGQTYLLVSFLLPIALELAIDSSIIYYLFKKIRLTNR